MRRSLALILLLMAALLVGGAPAASASPWVAAHSPRPPAWVAREVLWQSLSAGEGRPDVCWWSLTSGVRASHLAGTATGSLRTFPGSSRVYLVVIGGHFSAARGRVAKANRLYFVLQASSHAYLSQGLASARHLDLKAVARLHRNVPRLSFASGLWGQTMVVCGPAPGGSGGLLPPTTVTVEAVLRVCAPL